MSYTPMTKQEQSKLIHLQCPKCKEYTTRLDYHVCDKQAVDREAINAVTNWQDYENCGNYN